MTDVPPPTIEGYPPKYADAMAGQMGPFNEHMGLRLTHVSPDRLEAAMVCDERHHQPMGIVHGGVWCSIVETLASMAGAFRAAADGNVVVGVNNSTDFLRAHRTGPVTAVATPIHVGRMQHLWAVDITRDEDGKTVARGQVRIQVLPMDRELAGQTALPNAATPSTDPQESRP